MNNITEIEKFNSLLSTPPAADEIAERDGIKYIPIGVVQAKLDRLFLGMWKTENFRGQVVANEIVGSVDLSYFHPVAGQWITRTGNGAVMIQQDAWAKDESGNPLLDSNGKKIRRRPLPTDVDAKILNTLVKDYPHLLAECLKNAARSIGVAFGRDLNRDTDKTQAVGSIEPVIAGLEKQIERAHMAALEAATVEALVPVFDQFRNVPGIVNIIKERRKQLTDGNEGA